MHFMTTCNICTVVKYLNISIYVRLHVKSLLLYIPILHGNMLHLLSHLATVMKQCMFTTDQYPYHMKTQKLKY